MIKNLINDKCYIGWHVTNKELEKDAYFGSGQLLHKAIKKYGIENFVKGVIEYIDINDWKEKEQYWIKQLKSHTSDGGYNMTFGGDGTLGKYHTKESNELNRIAHTGKITSNETKLKQSNSHLGIIQHSDEFKKKVAENNRKFKTGTEASIETKLKMSKTRKGVPKSEETKKLMSDIRIGKPHPHKGTPRSKKVSESLEEFLHNDINERSFSQTQRTKLAKNHNAMPDGSYPIVTVEDLRNAIKAYGRAKNKAAVKAHIKKRARALGKSGMVPEYW
jgi:group I intron endonuclease